MQVRWTQLNVLF